MTTQERFAVLAKFVPYKKGTASVRFNHDRQLWEVSADVGTDSRKYAKIWDAEDVAEAVEVEVIING